MPTSEPEGVWVVFIWDDPYWVYSVHADELEARRCAQDRGHAEVAFVPFGADFLKSL